MSSTRRPKLGWVKEWFVIIDHQQEGPYSLWELKAHPRFTPDSLVWKKGLQEWVRARNVPEMRGLFHDDEEEPSEGETSKVCRPKGKGESELAVLTMQQDPYQFVFWLVLILVILFYSLYQYYKHV